MGNEYAFLPRHLKLQLNDFIDLHFDRWYTDFVRFRSSHSTLKPCTKKRTNAIIIDGHVKLRRRLGYNQELSLLPSRPFELVFDSIVVGCLETPSHKSRFCHKCASSLSDSTANSEKRILQTRQPINSLSEVSVHLIIDSCQNEVFLIMISFLKYSYHVTLIKRNLPSLTAT